MRRPGVGPRLLAEESAENQTPQQPADEPLAGKGPSPSKGSGVGTRRIRRYPLEQAAPVHSSCREAPWVQCREETLKRERPPAMRGIP